MDGGGVCVEWKRDGDGNAHYKVSLLSFNKIIYCVGAL